VCACARVIDNFGMVGVGATKKMCVPNGKIKKNKKKGKRALSLYALLFAGVVNGGRRFCVNAWEVGVWATAVTW
jgi:hypothetical protein